MSRSMLRIGEMARLLGITPKTVRHYHKLGLLTEPERSEGGYRLYSAEDLFHLRRIRRLQSLGLSLQQIQFILDDENPDELLRLTLEGLRSELLAQQQRIEARRERIEGYLAEGVSLVKVEQPETPSPTYQMLQGKLPDLPSLPDGLVQFDKEVFGHWDAFNWGEEYTAAMQVTVEYFQNHEAHQLMPVLEKMVALQTMAADDPQVQLWADEMKASGLMDTLSAGLMGVDPLTPPLAETMKHIFMQSADTHLSPALRRFLELLVS